MSLSATIAPVMGEYERSSTAVLNAYVAPRTVAYLRALNEKLAALGLPRSMLLIQNNGGAVSVEEGVGCPAVETKGRQRVAMGDEEIEDAALRGDGGAAAHVFFADGIEVLEMRGAGVGGNAGHPQ